MIFIDTNIAIGLIHKLFPLEKIQPLLDTSERIAITSITMYELYYGLFNMENNKNAKKSLQAIQTEKKAINQLKNSIDIVEMNDQAAYRAAEIFHRLRGEGQTVEEFDCMIAGIVLSTGSSKIITNDAEHFSRIPEIHVLAIK
jgi:predicted nucleic acid-binding protein